VLHRCGYVTDSFAAGVDGALMIKQKNTVELEQDVSDALGSGRKIEAIKLLRAHRNIDLKQAKKLVDRHIRENPKAIPSVQKTRSGNGIMIVVFFVVVAYLLYDYAS
jgi:hypothetical protein